MPKLVRGGHDLEPLRGGQLALGQHPAHLVVEDLRSRSGDRTQPGVLYLTQPLAHWDPSLRRGRGDLHGRERVDVDAWRRAGHRAHDVHVCRAAQRRVDAPLEADLGGTEGLGLRGALADLLQRQRVRVGVGAPLGERTEPASHITDVGEVDVPVDDVGDVLADGAATQVVGQGGDRL